MMILRSAINGENKKPGPRPGFCCNGLFSSLVESLKYHGCLDLISTQKAFGSGRSC